MIDLALGLRLELAHSGPQEHVRGAAPPWPSLPPFTRFPPALPDSRPFPPLPPIRHRPLMERGLASKVGFIAVPATIRSERGDAYRLATRCSVCACQRPAQGGNGRGGWLGLSYGLCGVALRNAEAIVGL